MRTVQEITQTPLLQLNKPKLLTHGMKIYNAPYEGGAFTFKLNGITTPFAPSVFNGTGEETRQSVVFSIPEDVYKLLRSFEDGFKAQLSASECPKVEEMWYSSFKPAEKYAATFRAKINLSGDKSCAFFTTNSSNNCEPHLTVVARARAQPLRRRVIHFMSCHGMECSRSRGDCKGMCAMSSK